MSKYKIAVGGSIYEVEIHEDAGSRAKVSVNGVLYDLEIEYDAGPRPAANLLSAPVQQAAPPPSKPKNNPGPKPASRPSGSGVIAAPMPGTVLEVTVREGQKVKAGDVVVRIEAMKMENDITCTVDGVVKEVNVRKGDQVQEHDVLLVLGD